MCYNEKTHLIIVRYQNKLACYNKKIDFIMSRQEILQYHEKNGLCYKEIAK